MITFGLGKGISSALSKSSSAQMSSAIRELEKETLEVAKKTSAITNVAQTISNPSKGEAKAISSIAARQTEKSVEKAATASETGVASKLLGAGKTYTAHESGEFGLMAHLDEEGILNLYIKAKESITPRGGEMFKEAMEQFGTNVKGVRGTWIGGGDIPDNFDSFKAALSAGAKPEQAAFKTFTGKMAERAGFTTAKVVENDLGKVVVEFRR